MVSDTVVWAGLVTAAVVLTVLAVVTLEYGEQAGHRTVHRGAARTAAARTLGHPLVFLLLVLGLFGALVLAIAVYGV